MQIKCKYCSMDYDREVIDNLISDHCNFSCNIFISVDMCSCDKNYFAYH